MIQTADINLYRGDDDGLLIKITDKITGQAVDLSGADIRMSVRPWGTATPIDVPPETVHISDAAAGELSLLFDGGWSETANWNRAAYDVRMLADGAVRTLLRGTIRLTDRITPMPAAGGNWPGQPRQIQVALERGRPAAVPPGLSEAEIRTLIEQQLERLPTAATAEDVAAIGEQLATLQQALEQAAGRQLDAEAVGELIQNRLAELPDTAGEVAKLAGEVAGAVKQVETIAAMLAWAASVPPAAGKSVQVAGYRQAGDGGGGLFVYDPALAALNDGGCVLNGWVRQVNQYVTPEMFGVAADGKSDAAAILQGVLDNPRAPAVHLKSGHYLLSAPLRLPANKHILSERAQFSCTVAIAGDAPYQPRGLLMATNISGLKIEGTILCRINHNDFYALGTTANKPIVVALLVNNCSGCDFGEIDAVGAANYYTTPGFVEYGIIDMRDSTDCAVAVKVDGRYTKERPKSTPNTVGVFGRGNTRCNVSGMVSNTYWSGILWDGTDCKVINPIVRNTKGSNLNLSGTNTNAYNVDLKKSNEGNVSIGEGVELCYSCSIYGGDIGDARYANVALHNSATACQVQANIYGWGQLGKKNEGTVGVRVRGHGNIVNVVAKANRDGKQATGDAVTVISDTLSNPNTADNTVVVHAQGAGVHIKAPRTTIEADITGTSGNAVYMGYRCAGSVAKYIKATQCLRPIYYEPNLSDEADAAGVQIGTILSVDCAQPPALTIQPGRRRYAGCDDYYPQKTTLAAGDLLGGIRAFSADTRLPAGDKPAAAVTMVAANNGDAYNVALTASAIVDGTLKHAAHAFSAGGLDVHSVNGASQITCAGPDGKRYRLSPPDGGGPATWVLIEGEHYVP